MSASTLAGPVATAASVEQIEAFVSRYASGATTIWHSVTTPDRIAVLAAERARRLLTGPKTETLLSHHQADLVGVVCWTWLDWDTEQFGFPAARLDLLTASGDRNTTGQIKNNLVNDALRDCRNRGVRHVTARVDAGDLTSIAALERNGFELIDGIQTFSLKLPAPLVSDNSAANSVTIRLYRDSDLPQILDIARSAYIYDRFHADSALDDSIADRINETWVYNSCVGTMADAVIVASTGDRVLSYVTCRIDKEATRVLGIGCGEIGMVATADHARKAGAASAATIGALEWFAAHRVSAVEVGTQLRNIPAARLYERCGFRLTAVNLTWRKVI